jgi:hypothetical protein
MRESICVANVSIVDWNIGLMVRKTAQNEMYSIISENIRSKNSSSPLQGTIEIILFLNVYIYILCPFLSVHRSLVPLYQNHANTNRKKQNKAQYYTQKRHGKEKKKSLYIYNLTKLKGNETKTKRKLFFFVKKKRTKLNQKKNRNE